MGTGADIAGAAVIAGNVYRDLDGSLVRLLNVERDLCHWITMNEGPAMVQITHVDNFRRRFRAFQPSSLEPTKMSA